MSLTVGSSGGRRGPALLQLVGVEGVGGWAAVLLLAHCASATALQLSHQRAHTSTDQHKQPSVITHLEVSAQACRQPVPLHSQRRPHPCTPSSPDPRAPPPRPHCRSRPPPASAALRALAAAAAALAAASAAFERAEGGELPATSRTRPPLISHAPHRGLETSAHWRFAAVAAAAPRGLPQLLECFQQCCCCHLMRPC